MYIRKRQHFSELYTSVSISLVNTVSTEVLSFGGEKKGAAYEGGYLTTSDRDNSAPSYEIVNSLKIIRNLPSGGGGGWRETRFSSRDERNLVDHLPNARDFFRLSFQRPFPCLSLSLSEVIIGCPRTRTTCRIRKVSVERRASAVARQSRASPFARHMEDL